MIVIHYVGRIILGLVFSFIVLIITGVIAKLFEVPITDFFLGAMWCLGFRIGMDFYDWLKTLNY